MFKSLWRARVLSRLSVRCVNVQRLHFRTCNHLFSEKQAQLYILEAKNNILSGQMLSALECYKLAAVEEGVTLQTKIQIFLEKAKLERNLGLLEDALGDYQFVMSYVDNKSDEFQASDAQPSSADTFSLYSGLALVHAEMSSFDEAKNMALVGREKSGDNTVGWAECFNELGYYFYKAGKIKDAEYFWKECLNFAVIIEQSDKTYAMKFKAEVMKRLGKYYKAIDEFDEARKAFQTSHELSRDVYSKTSVHVAETIYELGSLYLRKDVNIAFRYASIAREKLRSCNINTTHGKQVLFSILALQAQCLSDFHKYDDVNQICAKILSMTKKYKLHNITADVLTIRALNYYKMKEFDFAKKSIFEAIKLGKVHSDRVSYINQLDVLAFIYEKEGDGESAEQTYQESIELSSSTFGENSLQTLKRQKKLANIYFDIKKFDAAAKLYRTLLDKYQALGVAEIELCPILAGCTKALAELKDYKTAIQYKQRELKILKEKEGEYSEKTMRARMELEDLQAYLQP